MMTIGKYPNLNLVVAITKTWSLVPSQAHRASYRGYRAPILPQQTKGKLTLKWTILSRKEEISTQEV
jgi:hypothetical protein